MKQDEDDRKILDKKWDKLNQKVTIIGKINDGYKKNLLKEGNKSLKLSNFKGYSHKF